VFRVVAENGRGRMTEPQIIQAEAEGRGKTKKVVPMIDCNDCELSDKCLFDTFSRLSRNGWRFAHDDATGFVVAEHENRRGRFSVCQVVTPPERGDAFRRAVGRGIAAFLTTEGCPYARPGN
jgi:hypothetical protein